MTLHTNQALPQRIMSQATLIESLGITQPLKEETQTETRPVARGGLRIYYQNIHGIKPTTREWSEMITKMTVNQVGVFEFAETNHKWNPVSNRIFLHQAKHAIQNESGKRTNLTIQTAACTGWLGGEYQAGGGACTGALEGWATRISKKEEDPAKLGRWSSLRIQLKGIEINFITAYWVNKSHISLETTMAYAQQWKEMT